MSPIALAENDPRVQRHYLDVDIGVRYHYIVAVPEKQPIGTVLLLHGWPDLAMGWRFQVPHLMDLGLRVIVPDMLGYGKSSAPEDTNLFSLKTMSSHMAALIRKTTDGPIILGGHDWGAFLAWRLAMYFPDLIRAIFTFCIPYFPPEQSFISLEQVVAKKPIFQYQIQNSSGEAERIAIKSPQHLRGYINAMFGGTTPEGLPGFDPHIGILEDRILQIGPTPLMTPQWIDYYVREFSRSGLHAPMNWYRTRRVNIEEELPLVQASESFKFKMPAMLVMAGQDPALTPSLADGTEKYFEAGLKKEVVPGASHWILVDSPEESNRYISEFVASILAL